MLHALRRGVEAVQGHARAFDEFDRRITERVKDGLYHRLRDGGWLKGVSGRVIPVMFSCVARRMEVDSVLTGINDLCLEEVDAEKDVDQARLFGAVEKDTPGAEPVNVDGKLVYEAVFPYGKGPDGVVARSGCNHLRKNALGPYGRYVVDRLVAHFDPEDRGCAAGRKAMRKYAHNVMIGHGVRAFDIASTIDKIVLAAVAKVDASYQIRAHNLLLEAGTTTFY